MKKKKQNGRFRKTVSYQSILLGVSTLVATTLLSLGNLATKDAIALRIEEDLKASLAQVVPAELFDNDLLASTLNVRNIDDEPVLVYQARKDNRVSAVIFEVAEQGYSGVIRSILSIAPDGKILGVRILAHTETPGLGDKIEVEKDPWILAFNGRSLDEPMSSNWRVKKDGGYFDQFSGATITPRAVVKSVHTGLEFFETRKATLLEVADVAGPEAATPIEAISGLDESEPAKSDTDGNL